MNEHNLENANLDGDVSSDATATVVSEDTGSEVSTDTTETTEVTVDAGAEVTAESDGGGEPVTVAPVAATVRKGAGRKVDTSGKTALGKARLLYAENSTLTPKQLKQLFETALPAAGFANVTPAVCQTYASLVRKKKTA